MYRAEEWRWHTNWRRHLPGTAGFIVLARLAPIIAFFTLEAVCVCSYHAFLEVQAQACGWRVRRAGQRT